MRYFVFLICISVSGTAFADAVARITGPTEANPGDLVILSAAESDGDSYSWTLANSSKAFLPVEQNTKCVFASGEPGKYVFVLGVSKANPEAGSTVDVVTHTVVVGIPQPQPPTPEPRPPRPNPSPEPTPGPDDMTEVERKVFDALVKDSAPKDIAGKIANNLTTNAGKAAGLSWSLQQLHNAIQADNAKAVPANQRQRFATWAMVFADLMKQTTDILGAIEQLNEIAAGMDAYSASASTSSGKHQTSEGSSIRQKADEAETTIDQLRERIGL